MVLQTFRVRFCLPGLLLLTLMATGGTAAETPAVVYRWDAAAWLKSYNQAQFSASPITNPDGSTGACIAVTPRSAANPYNMIIGTSASLKGGNEYTAAVTFSVVEPTAYPKSFYMFARNSEGNEHDLWQTWIGLPGPTRTVTLPLDLKTIGTGTWKLFMGISGSGALNIHSIVVYGGTTSDGVSATTTVPPVLDAKPVSNLVKRVTEATGYTPFTVAPPAAPVATVSLSDFRFVADTAGAPMAVAVANAAALQEAINTCKDKGATKLVIPKGTYRIAPASSILIESLKDLTLDGQGSVLVFEQMPKEGPGFLIKNCAHILVENLNLDWDWNVKPIASLGTVSNLTPDKLQCDFTFPDLNAAQTNLARTTPWRGIFSVDPVHFVRNGGVFSPPKEAVITAGSAANVLHVTFPKPVPLVDGSTYCIRHLYYEMGGFKVASSSDVTFDAVNIFSMPGMGWFFSGAMHNFQLTRCNILCAPGSRTPLTTAADGIHVDQFIDNMNVEDCNISGTGDDGMNIHSECYQGNIILDPADPTKMTLFNCPTWQLRIGPGDRLDFYNADFSPLLKDNKPATVKVAKVSSANRGKPETVLQLESPVPAGVTAQSIVINGRYTASNVRITGCNIENSSARGILISAKNALIEGCHFRNLYSSGINLESDILVPLWTEGRGASNVLIKGNTFENINKQRRYNGAVIYTNTRMPWGPTKATLYEQITIEDNRFLNCHGPIVSLNNCSNLLVRSNQIKLTEPLENPSRFAGTLFVSESSDVSLGGNQWVNSIPAAPDGGVIYDPVTTSNVSTGINGSLNGN